MTRNASSPARIIIIDDHPIIIEGLNLLIAPHKHLQVVGHAGCLHSSKLLLKKKLCDLAIVDLRLPDGNGIELIKHIAKNSPDTRMMVLSMCDENTYAARAIHAGACTFIRKDLGPVHIINAINNVLAGEPVLSPALRKQIQTLKQDGTTSISDQLTDRELSIFEYIARGKSTNEIATHLEISSKTVSAHREHIKKKLGIRHHNDLICKATEWLMNVER